MTPTEVTQLISQVGFPIFVAGFMLLKQSKDTEAMTNVLTKLQTTIEALSSKIEGK
jgi:hypothetical protein